MNKRILSLLVTICLIATLIPTTIFAAGGIDLPVDPIDDGGVKLGDLDGNGEVNSDDAIRLLMHINFPEDANYSIGQATDYTRDGQINSDDAIHLLMHTMFPEDDNYKLDPLVSNNNVIELPTVPIS